MQHEQGLLDGSHTINKVDTPKIDVAIVRGKTSRDIIQGLLSWRIWLLLAWQDIRLRYRRSYLGPLWITISMAVTVYSMGFLYSKLFKMDLNVYYPFLAGGMLAWALISSLIIESTDSFIAAEGYLKQMKLPYTIFILRIASRSLITFFHNILVMLPIIFLFHVKFNLNFLMLIPGLLILVINAYGFGLLFAMVGARYRDLGPIITSLVQVVFFLTPIVWSPDHLPQEYSYINDFNPFAHYVALIREPMIGQFTSWLSLGVTCGLGIVGVILALLVFQRFRHRIIYWL